MHTNYIVDYLNMMKRNVDNDVLYLHQSLDDNDHLDIRWCVVHIHTEAEAFKEKLNWLIKELEKNAD